MPAKPGQKMVGAYVDVELAERFTAWARQTEGGASAALRRLMTEALDGRPPAAPAGAGTGTQVSVRFKPAERIALAEVARVRGTSPANWVRSLVLVHLTREPQWNEAELDAFREIARALAPIGNNMNQIARSLNVAVETGFYPPYQGGAAREAADLVRSEMRRLVALMAGNFDYWGHPLDEKPKPAPGAIKRADAEARAAERKRKNRPRRRPARFRGDD